MTPQDFLAIALGYVGCTAPDPRFLDLVAPGEDPARAQEMAKDSTCGLFVRGLLNVAGVTDARVVAPYHAGKVMSDLAAMAREAGALLPSLDAAAPGDLIMLGNPEHVFVLESLDGQMLYSVQGGERDAARNEQIQRLPRSVFGSGRAPLISSRPVELMISSAKLLERFAPESLDPLVA